MTNENWRPESPWWRLPEAERNFWMEQWKSIDDPYTFVELLANFLQTGSSEPKPYVDWPLVMVQWVLGSMSRYERERLYADAFFALEPNDNEGLPG